MYQNFFREKWHYAKLVEVSVETFPDVLDAKHSSRKVCTFTYNICLEICLHHISLSKEALFIHGTLDFLYK